MKSANTASSAEEETTHARANESSSGSSLDYRFYHRACELSGDEPSLSDFNNGRAKGLFRFTENGDLLSGLVNLYNLNLHNISGDWLVFSSKAGQISAFGSSPLQAVLTWVIHQPLDTLLP